MDGGGQGGQNGGDGRWNSGTGSLSRDLRNFFRDLFSPIDTTEGTSRREEREQEEANRIYAERLEQEREKLRRQGSTYVPPPDMFIEVILTPEERRQRRDTEEKLRLEENYRHPWQPLAQPGFHFKPLPPPLCPSCFWKNPHRPSSCLKDDFPGYRYSITCYQCKDHSAHSAEVTPEKQTERDELLKRQDRLTKLHQAQRQAQERIYNRTITISVLLAIIVNCLVIFLLSLPPQKWILLAVTLPPAVGMAVAIGEICAKKIANRKIKKLSEQSLTPGI